MNGLVLVTGASGFVGGAVCRALHEKGYTVRSTGRKRRPDHLPTAIDYRSGDLCDPVFSQSLLSGVEIVIHAAAKAGVWGPEEDYRRANVDATKILLSAAQEGSAKAFVFTSTPSVVFNGKPIQNGDEKLPYGTNFPCAYPATKAAAERLVLHADGKGIRTLALRPHLIWGPGDPHLFPRVFERVNEGKLKVVGTGKNRVDLTFIDNVAAGHVAAVETLVAGKGGGQEFFLTQDEPVELWPFINQVLKATGRTTIEKKVPLFVANAAGAVCESLWKLLGRKDDPPMTRFVAKELATDHWFSSQSARETLGYKPVVSMEEGLERYLKSLTS